MRRVIHHESSVVVGRRIISRPLALKAKKRLKAVV